MLTALHNSSLRSSTQGDAFNTIDYHTRCVVTLYPKEDGQKPFDVIVYGRAAEDLMTVPNAVIHTLAERYPDYYSSPFDVY